MDCCFVYGTLRRGFGNHRIMREVGGKFLGEAISVVAFPLVIADLPYLLDYPGEGFRVVGEVYGIADSAGWERLDQLEGHPDFYRRRRERFKWTAGGGQVEAWVYFLARPSPDLRQLKPVRSFGEEEDFRRIT